MVGSQWHVIGPYLRVLALHQSNMVTLVWPLQSDITNSDKVGSSIYLAGIIWRLDPYYFETEKKMPEVVCVLVDETTSSPLIKL